MAATAGALYAVQALGTCFGQRIMLTHSYALTQVVGVVAENVALQALLDAIGNGVGGGNIIETKYLACLPDSYLLDEWRGQQVRPFRTAYRSNARAVVGTHAGNSEATNQSVAITLRSDVAGRWALGTKKIGPIPQDITVQDNGLITGAYKTLLETLGAALLGTVVAAGCTWEPCIIHPVGEHLGSTPLTSQIVQLTLRTMRRRTVRVGE